MGTSLKNCVNFIGVCLLSAECAGIISCYVCTVQYIHTYLEYLWIGWWIRKCPPLSLTVLPSHLRPPFYAKEARDIKITPSSMYQGQTCPTLLPAQTDITLWACKALISSSLKSKSLVAAPSAEICPNPDSASDGEGSFGPRLRSKSMVRGGGQVSSQKWVLKIEGHIGCEDGEDILNQFPRISMFVGLLFLSGTAMHSAFLPAY